ncbi:hypothetical protein B0O99DRAFT_663354 [Bisporella sp. PMI_857]|nr:hypothetical protein B0O99DRAFT_663354 [Bisporella sp. PMI_857]
MDKVTKVYFDPLLGDRAQIKALLLSLPVGSAHPFNKELLLHTQQGFIQPIDISMHDDDYFSNTVSLADLGEDVLNRMKRFREISEFNESFTIQQAPSPKFKIPLVNGKIHIFAVSQRTPTYYDLCIGDSGNKTSCYNATNTFAGIHHSGDINSGNNLLQYLKIRDNLDDTPRTVFVSGYSYTALSRYRDYNPLVLVADHQTKTLYIVPVPLDAASIGDATICCPLVIRKDEGSLICSILPTPGVETDKMCSGETMPSSALPTAISRADFVIEEQEVIALNAESTSAEELDLLDDSTISDLAVPAKSLVIATHGIILPTLPVTTQLIRFGKGLQWMVGNQTVREKEGSLSVFPCILGGLLEGPMVLATGELPVNVPFNNTTALRRYLEQAKSITIIVDEKMTDNSRNLASKWRINGLFIIQKPDQTPGDTEDVTQLLEKLNINAVTALAGPQSLVVAQLGNSYYFYRGISDPKYLDSSSFKFGQDITELINRQDFVVGNLFHPSWPRLINLAQDNPVYMPVTNQSLQIAQLKHIFESSSLADIRVFKDDIVTMVPQLQALLSDDKLQALCSELLDLVNQKITTDTAPARSEYAIFVSRELDIADPESVKKKNALLSTLRKLSKESQKDVQWLTEALGNVVSTQTSSSRTHDLKRLVRQNAIKNNVDAAKTMNFQQLGELLELHADQMGVLVVHVDTGAYQRYLTDALYAKSPPQIEVCSLDTRTIHLDGLDAGIVLEQSQEDHNGPLVSQSGRKQPIMAMSSLDKESPHGSMLAWVCWDEFVTLEDPYAVRWMEKCNDPHIAALRIIMRSTLSDAISSRELGLTASSLATGQLMASLLMSAMQKLAATRTSPPQIIAKPTDTSTLLMRGLFGNLLTVAGSGVKPMSFVWQLFGKFPQFEVPNTDNDWYWYETLVRLMPYTGWQVEQLKSNVIGLLDKVIFGVITKNNTPNMAQLRLTSLEDHCKARNIQLLHSRTIITVLKRMLTEQEDCKDAASRLLSAVPAHVDNQTESYRRLYRYIVHLSSGGQKRADDNMIAANVFTKRSAVFSDAKKKLVNAASDGEKDKTIDICQQILKLRSDIEKEWSLNEEAVHIQGLAAIQEVLNSLLAGKELDKKLVGRLKGDGELRRSAWQIGDGKYGTIEELHEGVMEDILHGTKNATSTPAAGPNSAATLTIASLSPFDEFKESTNAKFLEKVHTVANFGQVCGILNTPESALEAFAALLAPGFQSEELPGNFSALVLQLLRNRNRDADKMKPALKLFGVVPITGF